MNGQADFRLVDERDAYDRLAERAQHREEAIAALTAERDRLAERAKRLNSELLDAAVRRDRAEHQVKRVRDWLVANGLAGEASRLLDGGAS